MANNHITGARVRLSMRIKNVPLVVLAETIDFDENADEGVDEVCGEDAGRPWIEADYWTIAIKAYESQLQVLDAWLADQANQSAALADFEKEAIARFLVPGGVSKAYKFVECCRSPISLNVGGRKSRIMTNYKFRARRCLPVAATSILSAA